MSTKAKAIRQCSFCKTFAVRRGRCPICIGTGKLPKSISDVGLSDASLLIALNIAWCQHEGVRAAFSPGRIALEVEHDGKTYRATAKKFPNAVSALRKKIYGD